MRKKKLQRLKPEKCERCGGKLELVIITKERFDWETGDPMEKDPRAEPDVQDCYLQCRKCEHRMEIDDDDILKDA